MLACKPDIDNNSQGNSGLSLSDQIALGVGLGIGIPTLLVAIGTWIFRPWYLRRTWAARKSAYAMDTLN